MILKVAKILFKTPFLYFKTPEVLNTTENKQIAIGVIGHHLRFLFLYLKWKTFTWNVYSLVEKKNDSSVFSKLDDNNIIGFFSDECWPYEYKLIQKFVKEIC